MHHLLYSLSAQQKWHFFCSFFSFVLDSMPTEFAREV